MTKYCAVILADRDGKTFRSQYPQALAQVVSEPLAWWAVNSCRKAGAEEIVLVTGRLFEETAVPENDAFTSAADLAEAAQLAGRNDGENVWLMTCTRPLLSGEMLRKLGDFMEAQGAQAADLADSGIMCIKKEVFCKLAPQMQGADTEKIKELLAESGIALLSLPVEDREREQLREAASCRDLMELTEKLSRRRAYELMDEGVRFTSLDGVLVSPRASVGADTVIHSGTHLLGQVTIGSDCRIGPSTIIENSTVGSGTMIHSSFVEDSQVGSGVRLGPNSHLRPKSVLKDNVKIGNFVEVKNSTLGEKTSVAHLTYIGDSDFGSHINVGCGVVCVNYNGYTKARTVVEDDAFIGCNTNLIAPVTVRKGAYTAAGSTITDEVPEDAMGIARARQVNKEGWAAGHRQKYSHLKKK